MARSVCADRTGLPKPGNGRPAVGVERMLRIYFLQQWFDLSDPAVDRRVAMLRAGGAAVTLAGFRRGAAPEAAGGLASIDLGRTQDGRFPQRIASVATHRSPGVPLPSSRIAQAFVGSTSSRRKCFDGSV